MISRHLLAALRAGFQLRWDGIHGAPHWTRVRQNGLRLARTTGANTSVVELFAFLHDARRESEGRDPQHGARAADFARTLLGSLIQVSPEELELLCEACRGHSEGRLEADVTVQTCWDADRLDLGRIGIKPDARYLCTAPAREPHLIEWAYARSIFRSHGDSRLRHP